MAISRDDRTLTDAQGRSLAGAQVYWCLQPATVPTNGFPSPLATIYSDLIGTPEGQPIFTDGFGHAWAYMDDSVLYTLAFYHPLFLTPIVWTDQRVGGGGSGGSTIISFAGTPQGTIDGVNQVFTVMNGSSPIPVMPTQISVWLNFPLIQGLGYAISLIAGYLSITYANAPQPASGSSPADALWAQGYIIT